MANLVTGKKLDDKVIISMLLVSILFLGITAFRYNSRVKCTEVSFVYRAPNDANFPYINDVIYFTADLGNFESWEWDFGDKTPIDKKSMSNASHQYKNPGDYVVKLIVNGECQGTKNIRINKRLEEGKKLSIRAYIPTTVYRGIEYNFVDSTTGATSWSWGFDNNDPILQQNAKKIFNDLGVHKVQLILNGDYENNYVMQEINVVEQQGINVPKPVVAPRAKPIVSTGGGDPTPTQKVPDQPSAPAIGPGLIPDLKKTPSIEDDELRGKLLTMNSPGFNMFEVDKYFQNGHLSNCRIIFNDKGLNGVEELKQNINYHNKYGLTFSVKQIKHPEKNYITQISITATLNPDKKSSFWGLKRGEKFRYPYPVK